MKRKGNTEYPIRQWRLRNFKSVAEATVDFAPLTVLVGPNSSGKSSLIQSILLVVQAAQSYWSEAALPLNGQYVELGDFRDLRFAGASTRAAVAVGGSFRVSGAVGRLQRRTSDTVTGVDGLPEWGVYEWDAELVDASGDDPTDRARLRAIRFSAPASQDVVERIHEGPVQFEASTTRRRSLELRRAPRRVAEQSIVPLAGKLSYDTGAGSARRFRTAAVAHRGGLPVCMFVRGDNHAILVDEWVRRTQKVLRDRRRRPRGDAPRASSDLRVAEREWSVAACERIVEAIVAAIAADSSSSALRTGAATRAVVCLEELRQEMVRRGSWRLVKRVQEPRFARTIRERVGRGEPVLVPAEEVERLAAPARDLELGGTAVARFVANRICYLGPLRQDPQVLYTSAPTEQRGYVGNKGEFAFAVLHRHGQQPVVCPLEDGSTRVLPLCEAVNYWLSEFGLADSIETVFRPRLGLEPQIRVAGVARSLDMTAVGVGVSQVLPVLVMGLHSKPGSVLLIEQPELHLHPAMQQKLGDFLLACADSGRQVVVETHSDHLVTRLRRRVAEDTTDHVLNLVGLVFTERPGGRTVYRRLASNRYGGLDEWPQGFFDEGATEAQKLLRAGLRKRKSAAG